MRNACENVTGNLDSEIGDLWQKTQALGLCSVFLEGSGTRWGVILGSDE